jgi:NAD dependent epimerase/dehydratase family enzyme
VVITGEARVGAVPNTAAPLPVSSVNADAKLAELGVARKVATPVPKPEIPVETGSPVALVKVPEDGVPSAGVTRVGDVANTSAPDPVSSVTAVAKLALEGVARKLATPVPSPEIPVLTGRPVAFVKTAAEGVPSAGVTKVGDVANTAAPDPVSSVNAAARLAELGVARKVATPVPSPLTPVEIGRPVALVKVPDAGVPNTGVTKVGDVAKTGDPVPVGVAQE